MSWCFVLIGVLFACPLRAETLSATDADRFSAHTTPQDDLDPEYARLLSLVRQQRPATQDFARQLDIASHPQLGSSDAPIAVIEFASFQCPYCRRHLLETMPQVKKAYVDTGKLLYVFYDFALDPEHQYAEAAAQAARCANEQGRYWAFRNRLYRNQKALHPTFLEGHAEAAGLDVAAFNACLASERYRQHVRADRVLSRELQVRGTPAFFIGRLSDDGTQVAVVKRITGAQSFAVFAEQAEALLATR